MAVCDLCNSEIDLSTADKVTPDAMRKAMFAGFSIQQITWSPNISMFVALGLSAESFEIQWKELVLTAKTDWACCSRCYPVVERYLARK